MADMLKLLLETAAEITRERLARGIPAKEAVVVLLWDDVRMHSRLNPPNSDPSHWHCSPVLSLQLLDLIKDPHLDFVHGEYVFDFLSRQLINYGTYDGSIRAFVTGSSAELLFGLERAGASGARVEVHTLLNPPEDETQKALVKAGYSKDDAARLVQLCGARMRVLQGSLRHGRVLPVDEVIQRCNEAATRQYESFFVTMGRRLDGGSAYASVIKLLDRIEASEADRSITAPLWRDLPPSAISADISRLVFIGVDYHVRFQSRTHRRVWGSYRASFSDYAAGSGGSGGQVWAPPARAGHVGQAARVSGIGVKGLGDL